MANGRPLRFLGLVLGSWVAIRIAVLWPAIETLPDLVHAVVPRASAADADAPLKSRVAIELPSPVVRFGASVDPAIAPALEDRPQLIVTLNDAADLNGAARNEASQVVVPGPAAVPTGLAPPVARTASSRWSASMWVIGRGGSGSSLDAPQLGGSQAGARIAYLVDRRHRLALAARIATPFAGRGREAAIGVDWQPTRFPVRLLIEQRFGLDGQRGGPAALLVGGFGPAAVWRGFTLEGYGEGGAVARRHIGGFADGALRFAHPIATVENIRFDLGAGLWGAAQRGVGRLDVGPSVGATIPIVRKALRLSVDWRQRIAGNARPDSGPAVTLGADF